jgi:transcriptional regulator with XRE-family HTH domain
MKRRRRLPSQLAKDLKVSHSTVGRWLSGQDIPGIKSCRKLSAYSGIPLRDILGYIGHLPGERNNSRELLPEFREYALIKYPDLLTDDLITMVEDLIERRREKQSSS